MAEYRLSPAAERDLEEIITHTVRAWGRQQAERYLDIMLSGFERIARSPRSAPACNFIRSGYRRLRVEHHLVYFRITTYGVAIIRILHEKMDAPRHF